jgi:hypothetical protein
MSISLITCQPTATLDVMCSSDISTIHWVWVEEDGLYEADGRTMHTCRDFEAIREWTFANRVGTFDRSIYTPDPLAGEQEVFFLYRHDSMLYTLFINGSLSRRLQVLVRQVKQTTGAGSCSENSHFKLYTWQPYT